MGGQEEERQERGGEGHKVDGGGEVEILLT